jgi:hypothetical protein
MVPYSRNCLIWQLEGGPRKLAQQLELIKAGDTNLQRRYAAMTRASRVRWIPLCGLNTEERSRLCTTLGLSIPMETLEAAEFVRYDPCIIPGIPITHGTLNISDVGVGMVNLKS